MNTALIKLNESGNYDNKKWKLMYTIRVYCSLKILLLQTVCCLNFIENFRNFISIF